MTGTYFHTLFSELERTGNSLHVPDIVFREVVNNYCEEYNKIIRLAARIGITDHYHLFNIDDEKSRYEEYFRSRLSQVHYSLIGYPNISHETLAVKALLRKKPFKQNGSGYRDALIWANVLDLAVIGDPSPVGFVSENTNDFSSISNPNQLHPDLMEDMVTRTENNPIIEIRYFTSLESFVREQIIPSLDILAEIESSLRSNTYPNLNLKRFLEDDLYELALGREFSGEEISLPDEVNSASLSSVNDVLSIVDVTARKISDDEILIEFTAEADCEFDFYIHQAYADYSRRRIRIRMSLWDDDEDYVPASISSTVSLVIAIIYNTASRQITSKQILRALHRIW
jgi:hypothetical protein